MKDEKKKNSFLIIKKGKKSLINKSSEIGNEKKTIEDMVKKRKVVKISRRLEKVPNIKENQNRFQQEKNKNNYSGYNRNQKKVFVSSFNRSHNRDKEENIDNKRERSNFFIKKDYLEGKNNQKNKGSSFQGKDYYNFRKNYNNNNNSNKDKGTFTKRNNQNQNTVKRDFSPVSKFNNVKKMNVVQYGAKDRINIDTFNKNKNKNKKDDRNVFYKTKNQEKQKFFQQKQKFEKEEIIVPEKIKIYGPLSVSDFAKKLCMKANILMKKLFDMGVIVTINDYIDEDTAILLGQEYNCKVEVDSLYEDIVFKPKESLLENLIPRAPIITVMGHVDHGKTKLLDVIRNEDMVSKEYGSITQHIGAFEVEVNTPNLKEGKKIVFLDTPGHEAFSSMRMRGVKVTDIVLLVVAADSGIMPQTVEAVNHAKDAKIPIVVAINKIDLENANVDKVNQQLADIGLLIEKWGGDIISVEISAKKKININDLLEAIILQAEILELKGDPTILPYGVVIESKIDIGKGPIVRGIIQGGTLKIGQDVVSGEYFGKVRAILDHRGKSIKQATLSSPVELLGLNGIPIPGEIFYVVKNDSIARDVTSKKKEYNKLSKNKKVKISLSNIHTHLDNKKIKIVKIILKADVNGSLDALRKAIEKLSTETEKVKIIHSGVGGINENDIVLASISNAKVVGFNVHPNMKAMELANSEKINIYKYNIIYEIIDYIKGLLGDLVEKPKEEIVYGRAEVKELFKALKTGVIVGSYVVSGKIQKGKVRIIRENITIYESKILSLRRFKKDVADVGLGYECGIVVENYQDFKIGDIIESFE